MHIGNNKVGEVYLGSTKIGEGWTMVGGVLRQVFSSYIPPLRTITTYRGNSYVNIPTWADRVMVAGWGGGGAGGAGNGGNFTAGTGGQAGQGYVNSFRTEDIPSGQVTVTVGSGGKAVPNGSGQAGNSTFAVVNGYTLLNTDGGGGGARGGGGQPAGYDSSNIRYDEFNYFGFGATGGANGAGGVGKTGNAPGAGGGSGNGGIFGTYQNGGNGAAGEVTIVFVNDSWYNENN